MCVCVSHVSFFFFGVCICVSVVVFRRRHPLLLLAYRCVSVDGSTGGWVVVSNLHAIHVLDVF